MFAVINALLIRKQKNKLRNGDRKLSANTLYFFYGGCYTFVLNFSALYLYPISVSRLSAKGLIFTAENSR